MIQNDDIGRESLVTKALDDGKAIAFCGTEVMFIDADSCEVRTAMRLGAAKMFKAAESERFVRGFSRLLNHRTRPGRSISLLPGRVCTNNIV